MRGHCLVAVISHKIVNWKSTTFIYLVLGNQFVISGSLLLVLATSFCLESAVNCRNGHPFFASLGFLLMC